MTTFEQLQLLSWGANSHNQLGHGIESEQMVIPLAVDLKMERSTGLRVSDIKKVTGGAGHSLILTSKGEIYSCGLNNKGQAGKPRWKNKILKFERIEGLEDEVIIDVAAGWDSSMAINDKGNLYVWGSNAYGQLGLQTNSEITKSDACLYAPKKINFEENTTASGRDCCCKIAKISMGLRHSVIVTDKGKVLVSGYGNKSQLGLIDSSNKPIKQIQSFTQVPGLIGIKTAACGQHHTMVLTKEGDLYCWGDNKHGQLGLDIEKYPNVERPLKLQNLNIGLNGEIFTGWTHTAVFHGGYIHECLFDGKVQAWGRNTYGQLGCGESINRLKNWLPELVKNVPKFTQFSIGSEHNIALAEDGSIRCWGWNEHGNCGTGTEQDVRFPTIVKVPENSRGILVGTGSGHSFAVIRNEEKI